MRVGGSRQRSVMEGFILHEARPNSIRFRQGTKAGICRTNRSIIEHKEPCYTAKSLSHDVVDSESGRKDFNLAFQGFVQAHVIQGMDFVLSDEQEQNELLNVLASTKLHDAVFVPARSARLDD